MCGACANGLLRTLLIEYWYCGQNQTAVSDEQYSLSPGPPRLRNSTVCLFIIKIYETGNSVFCRNRYHGSRIRSRYQKESQASENYDGSGPHRTLEYRLCAVRTLE